MAPALARRRGEVLVHVQERGAGNVPGEVELPAASGVAEIPAAVDELVAHGPIVTRAGPAAYSTEPERSSHETDAISQFSSPLARRSSPSRASAGPRPAGGAEKPAGGITVTGVGTITSVPDEASFTIGVQTQGSTAREALAANSEQMRRVIDAVKSAGVDEERHQDAGRLRLGELRGRGPDRRVQRAGNSVLVTIHDLSKAGDDPRRRVERRARTRSTARCSAARTRTRCRRRRSATRSRMRARRPRRSRTRPVSGSAASRRSPRASRAGRSRTTQADVRLAKAERADRARHAGHAGHRHGHIRDRVVGQRRCTVLLSKRRAAPCNWSFRRRARRRPPRRDAARERRGEDGQEGRPGREGREVLGPRAAREAGASRAARAARLPGPAGREGRARPPGCVHGALELDHGHRHDSRDGDADRDARGASAGPVPDHGSGDRDRDRQLPPRVRGQGRRGERDWASPRSATEPGRRRPRRSRSSSGRLCRWAARRSSTAGSRSGRLRIRP